MTRLHSAIPCSIASVLTFGALSLLPAAGAAAPEATCGGETATLVGRPGSAELVGTSGRDVIVTNGVESVDALGGGDLICITGDTESVTAGSGRDDVRNLQTADGVSDGPGVWLGPGGDTYLGGPGPEVVFTDDDFPESFAARDDRDVVDTGAGADIVATGRPGSRMLDAVDLGPGRDSASLEGLAAGSTFSLAGGTGRDTLVTSEDATGALSNGRWVFDNRRSPGIATVVGEPVLSWTSFDVFVFEAPVRSVDFLGGDTDERLTADSLRRADMGAGNDVVRFTAAHPRGSQVAGGSGTDRFVTHRQDYPAECFGTATVRMGAGTYRCDDDARYRAAFDGFEVARIAAGRVDIVGSRRADQIVVHARCGGRVRAGYGADRVIIRRPKYRCLEGGWTPIRVDGGPGDDDLVGWIRRDVLIGGPGSDSADGGPDIDRCFAENRENCEE
ncbi:hypothetical protein [Nocardioides sp. GXZ039]|uniref:hypothetical protein n=1 Tax=Nocardioides sp. GXZ039 TaxID=3136018 RepID=UPI0030F42053